MKEAQWIKMFATNLERIIEESGMSRFELAQKSGVSEATISKYVNGLQMPGTVSVINLAHALGCTPGTLVDFSVMID